MKWEWDEGKSRKNQSKHKISFETAVLVFDDPHATSRLEGFVDGEERWETIGLVHGAIVVLVVHTFRGLDGDEVIRIISARKAAPHERRLYEAAH